MVAVACSSAAHGSGVGTVGEQRLVGFGAEHEPVGGLDAGQVVLELGVDQEHRGPGVLDDVLDLGRRQAEVDGHQDAAPAAHPVERGEQAGRVVGHDGHPLAGLDAQPVEAGGLGPGPAGHVARRSVAPTAAAGWSGSSMSPTRSG